jgi:hypothetical protein
MRAVSLISRGLRPEERSLNSRMTKCLVMMAPRAVGNEGLCLLVRKVFLMPVGGLLAYFLFYVYVG